jgi:hypothetical protein
MYDKGSTIQVPVTARVHPTCTCAGTSARRLREVHVLACHVCPIFPMNGGPPYGIRCPSGRVHLDVWDLWLKIPSSTAVPVDSTLYCMSGRHPKNI